VLCEYNSSGKLIDAIQLLIQLGIDANGKDNDGQNVLNVLCRYNLTENLKDAIELLIRHGQVRCEWKG
jgi:ankyrin repeat protein